MFTRFPFIWWVISGLVGIFLLANLIAYNHAYQFTHFSRGAQDKTPGIGKLKTWEKIETILLGVKNPRTRNTAFPRTPYKTVNLPGDNKLEGWLIPRPAAKGTVILFHGYGGHKSALLDRAYIFRQLGYTTFLVDFMGSGGSEGYETTIGFKEAAQVKMALEYIAQTQSGQIYLFGISMGAVAILKAVSEFKLNPAALIPECPFGSMYATTAARFRMMGLPAFPMAGLLVFWGGVQHNFWGFGHNPTRYAQAVTTPTLLLYGAQDPKVSRQETAQIFANLRGPKKLRIYPEAGHENYLSRYKHAWTADVKQFLANY